MEIAIWIIAICEVVRLIQNMAQLEMMVNSKQDKQIKRATDAFIASLKNTDEQIKIKCGAPPKGGNVAQKD